MLKQKHINVIRTCLKINRVFGNEKCKADIEETLKAFDEEIKKCEEHQELCKLESQNNYSY